MVISYLARIPAQDTLQTAMGTTIRRFDPSGRLQAAGQVGEFLLGRFSDRTKDVAVEYYRRRGRRPPYLEFAASPTATDAILDFTVRWGPLTRNNAIPDGWKTARREPWCPWQGDRRDFLMDLSGWRSLHQRFQKLQEVAAETTRHGKQALCDLLSRETKLDFDAGSLHLALAWDKKALQPQIVTESLYMAFIAMLWLDVAAHGRKLLRCADPGCGRYFSTDRPNKIYCDYICAQRTSRRNWWRRHGETWRKDRQR